jgi:hypothetical protein
MGNGAPFTRLKRSKLEGNHSPPTNAEVKKSWSLLPLSIFFHGVMDNYLNTDNIRFNF